jgi:hypothetical protein
MTRCAQPTPLRTPDDSRVSFELLLAVSNETGTLGYRGPALASTG